MQIWASGTSALALIVRAKHMLTCREQSFMALSLYGLMNVAECMVTHREGISKDTLIMSDELECVHYSCAFVIRPLFASFDGALFDYLSRVHLYASAHKAALVRIRRRARVWRLLRRRYEMHCACLMNVRQVRACGRVRCTLFVLEETYRLLNKECSFFSVTDAICAL